jgi:hypothetical protein
MFSLTASLIVAASGTLAAPSEIDKSVEREFRLYRIQVYNTYRTWRSEYDRRRAAGDAAYDLWKRSGGGAQEATELVVWFRGAKLASLAHVNRPLPALPEFRAPVQLAAAQAPPAPPQPIAVKKPARRTVERFHVRRLESGEAPRVAAAPREEPTARARRRSWQSVSAALFKGVVFGASRALPK